MLKVLSSILCDLDPKVKALGQKAGICDGVPSTSALVAFANSKDSDEPVLMCSQSLFCYNPQSMEVHVDQGSSQTLHF